MARLPDQLGLDPVAYTPQPVTGVAPTDFGFKEAGATAENVAVMGKRVDMMQLRAQAAGDRQAVLTSPQYQALAEQDARGFAADAGAWNGQPGFAADQVSKVQQRIADAQAAYAKAGATQGQLEQFRTLGLGQAARRGQEANQFEQAQLMKQAEQTQETTVNGLRTQMVAAFAAARQKIFDGFDGSTPTLVPQVQGAFDQAVQPVIDQAPANLQPRLKLEASVLREQATAEAGEFQGRAQDAYIATQGERQAGVAINTIFSNPSAYDQVTSDLLPKIIARLPGGLQAKASAELGEQAASARVTGLIATDHPDIAVSELNAGKYDQALAAKPEMKGELLDRAMAADRARGPDAIERATAAASAEDAIERNVQAIATTGKGFLDPSTINADVAAGILSADVAGRANFAAQKAAQIFAARGSVASMTGAQLSTEASQPPDFADPAAAARAKAVAEEIKARQEPGTWAFTQNTQTIDGQPMGAALQAKWQAALQGGPAQRAAMADYAGNMLGVQHQAGIATGQLQIVPKAIAASLATSITTAAPEGRLKAMSDLAALSQAMPSRVTAPDGTTVNARMILANQMIKAGLTPLEASAIADFGGDPAKLGRVVAAINDTGIKGALPKNATTQLTSLVRTDLASFLASSTADTDGPALAGARIQRTVLVAEHLMTSQHISPAEAAHTAAEDLSGGYRYVDGWRMPAQLANQPGSLPGVNLVGMPNSTDGAGAARIGAARILAGLTANGGAGLYAAGDADAPKKAADIVTHLGGWRTLPDDSGLALVSPKPDGTWTNVQDQYGRPVRATWAQLAGVALGQASPFAQPPANPVTTPAGQPVRAFSRSEGFGALAWSVEQQESRGVTGQANPKSGALGVMQLMPDQNGKPGTGHIYAQRLGLPWDPERAKDDAGYNRQIGQAALADLTGRYMTGANPSAGIGLAAAAYNAGEGWLTGFTDAKGYHPGWLQTIGDPRTGRISLDDFVKRIPFPETRQYVSKVLGRAVERIQERR